MSLTIPSEGVYSDLERDWIDLEPANVFPETQDSLWGTMRSIYAGYLQTNIIDVLASWWTNLDPTLATDPFLAHFEQLVGLPHSASSKSLDLRRAFVSARLERGPFTRSRRNRIIELFIISTFGPVVTFTMEGIPFDAGGIKFFSGEFDLTGTYTVTENITGFSFAVVIDDSIDVDVDGLTRELARISPYSFTITSAPL